MLEELAFTGTWRRYQRLAIDAFERDRAAGRRRTHIVAPPGSGKTLVGVELLRRVGRRSLVLAPNSAIQMQWPRAVRQFTTDARVAGTEPGFPITCLSYQSLAQLDDPEVALGRVAALRWATDRAAATGADLDEIEREVERFEGEAYDRRQRELRRITASVKKEIARGEHAGVELAQLLSASAKERVRRLVAAEVGAIVLDECHHLASLWGYVVRAVVGELGADAHVIGLTATPPGELTSDESELYAELLGPVDFVVPTPAVVRDGHLAPFQELAWLTEPLTTEKQWLSEHDTRFRELITALHDDAESDISFPRWVIARMEAETPPASGAGGRALPRLRRADGRARRGRPRAARPRRLARAARGLRAQVPRGRRVEAGGRALQGRVGRAPPARLPAHPHGDPPRHVGGRPAADGLPGEGDRARRGRLARDGGARRRAARAGAVRRGDGRLAPRRRAHRRARPGRRAPPATPSPRSPTTCAPRRCGRCSSPAAACAARRTTPSCCSPPCSARPTATSTCPTGRPSPTVCSSRCARRGRSGRRAPGWTWPRACSCAGPPACWSAPAACSARAGTAPPSTCWSTSAWRPPASPCTSRAGARCASTPRIRASWPPTGTSCAWRRSSCAGAPTTSASCAATCTCSPPPTTVRSRPARRTCTRS